VAGSSSAAFASMSGIPLEYPLIRSQSSLDVVQLLRPKQNAPSKNRNWSIEE